MAKVIKIFKTLRNHWKKSTFVAILGYYGIEYGRDWHRNYMMMREYSREALIYGQRPLPMGAKNKHITIFLNPTAGNRKSKTKLEKYAEPLFHLSGFLVNIVRTERIDEARDLAKIIDKTNIIAAAGGDGTLFETVTGVLRRDDAEEALKRYPIAVIPLGFHNQFANRLFHKEKKDDNSAADPKFIAEAAMALVKHKIRPQDVMEITITGDKMSNINGDDEAAEENVLKPPRKPFYSLAGIAIGQFREAQKIRDEMPSLFPNYFATFLSLYKTPQVNFRAEIRYMPACDGCMACIKPVKEIVSTKDLKLTSSNKSNELSFWSKIFSVFRPQPVHALASSSSPEETNPNNVKNENNTPFINPLCGTWTSLCVDTSEFNIMVQGNGRLQVQINNKFDKTDFMIEGLKRYQSNDGGNYSQLIDAQEVEIFPIEGQEFMSIDNEEFEMKPIKVKCLKEKVYFFVP